MAKKILFITGSMNQTLQMHQIASHLTDFECYFTQFYTTNPVANWLRKNGWFDKSIMAGKFRENSENYLLSHGLKLDYQGKNNKYDLAILCTDIVVQGNLKGIKKIWVQEGMVDPMNTLSKIVRALKLPRYFCMSTALNGSSNLCDIFCVASEGYKEFFSKMGTDERKIIVTGIPNFDNVKHYLHNNFPHKGYVCVTTSDIRELMGIEDRPAFIKECVKIANGRPLIFKLHPNEDADRARKEIRENAPEGTLVYTEGNPNHIIANCEELITQYSTLVYVGLALGKKCYSYFDLERLKRQTPIQNGGTSAKTIAEIARNFMETENKTPQEFVKSKCWIKSDRQTKNELLEFA